MEVLLLCTSVFMKVMGLLGMGIELTELAAPKFSVVCFSCFVLRLRFGAVPPPVLFARFVRLDGAEVEVETFNVLTVLKIGAVV